MDPLLALIRDLYAQVVALQQENEALREQIDQQRESTP